jgi:hypothetical protein
MSIQYYPYVTNTPFHEFRASISDFYVVKHEFFLYLKLYLNENHGKEEL